MSITQPHRPRLVAMLGALAISAGLVIAGTIPAMAVTPPADVVVQWNANAINAIITTAGQGPTVAYLHLAMVQGAVYDAVNGIDGGHQPYLGVPPAADPSDSMEAAAATAAHHVLVALFPAQVATLDAQYATSLGQIPDGASEAGGITVGEQAAATMLAARVGDGRFPVGYPPPVEGFGAGQWRRTPPAFVFEPVPWVGTVRPFVIKSAAGLRTDGPNRLKSLRYTIDFYEVMLFGALDSSVRTADQADAALFWQANGAALFNAIFRQLADTQDLDIVDAARMFAMSDLAGADGAIACWNDKYYWNFWRPITAIREAGNDGNPFTVADPTWEPLLSTPQFPEHPSGHTCISGAIVRTLQRFFGTDHVSFSTFSSLSGTTRSFDRFSEAIDEIVDARVWVGFHFRTADVQGKILGYKVARELVKGYFYET